MKNSDHDIIAFSAPAKMLGYSGERFTDAMTGAIDHEHRHRYLFALQFCQGKRVLDIASGEGYGSALLATVAKEVTGVDIDDETISHSRIAYSAPNLKFEVGDAMSIPLPDESVDIVVSFETIEHFEGHEKFLSEVRRVLAPGGMVIISSPIKEAYAANLEWKNPFHLKELTKNEFTALMGQHFSNVAYYEQMALMGSMILPASEANNASFTSFGRIDKHRFSRHTGGMNQALYAMIVASDIPLPSISPWGILEDNRYVEQLANIIRYNESLIATVQAEREQLKERNGYLVDAVNRAELRAEADARALAGQLAKLKKQVTGLNKRARALKKA
ncbi:class I SAM-dependent methyltransferase, partial [Pseudanabaenaceae cyanobacterium LEGE 13415]|nr:class I SAM-dependent methyltransferase [Pseudanabaenaceae cyanobacterium LEGE 13415]